MFKGIIGNSISRNMKNKSEEKEPQINKGNIRNPKAEIKKEAEEFKELKILDYNEANKDKIED